MYSCDRCWTCVCVFRYLVNLGCIKPLCDLLTVMDSKIVQVALNGLENILRLGEQEAKQENNGSGVNPYCSLIEEAYGTFPTRVFKKSIRFTGFCTSLTRHAKILIYAAFIFCSLQLAFCYF